MSAMGDHVHRIVSIPPSPFSRDSTTKGKGASGIRPTWQLSKRLARRADLAKIFTHGRFCIMTIHLSKDLEQIVHDAVRAGLYAHEDEVLRAVLTQIKETLPKNRKTPTKKAKERDGNNFPLFLKYGMSLWIGIQPGGEWHGRLCTENRTDDEAAV